MATATAEHAARMCASWWWAWRLGRGGRASAGAERARSAVRAHHLVCLHPIGEALRFDAAEITGASKPRVVGSMAMVSGVASAWRRAARFGVSPTTVCS
jgi:hypothetical protein